MGNGLNEPGEILEGHVFSKLTGLPPLCYRPVALNFAILTMSPQFMLQFVLQCSQLCYEA